MYALVWTDPGTDTLNFRIYRNFLPRRVPDTSFNPLQSAQIFSQKLLFFYRHFSQLSLRRFEFPFFVPESEKNPAKNRKQGG